jgi:hypothetical protein
MQSVFRFHFVFLVVAAFAVLLHFASGDDFTGTSVNASSHRWLVRGREGERCAVSYFTGAISKFFSMPFVAATPLLLVEQQARLSAPQLEHLWTAAVVFALP